jgi:hypothetical protein
MTYEDRCKSLGIDREAITKACADPESTAVGKERDYLTKAIGTRVKPLMEDLSRFVSKMGQKVAGKLRKRS